MIPCGRGVCAAEEDHKGTCAEASGWAPVRIQMSRRTPWRAHNPNAIICDRRTIYGNPFRVGYPVDITVGGTQGAIATVRITPALAVACFDDLMEQRLTVNLLHADAEELAFVQGWKEAIARLRGHDLACWCGPDEPCHCDVLLRLANPGVIS